MVFAENGFDVPLSSIARAAGVGQGVLYRHFPTRESIALAVFEENIGEVEAIAADPETTVDHVLEVIVAQLAASAAFVAMLDPTGTDDPRIFDVASRLVDLISRKLEDPDRRGAMRAEVTSSDVVMAVAMLAAILTKTDPSSRADVAGRAWSLLERGLHGDRDAR